MDFHVKLTTGDLAFLGKQITGRTDFSPFAGLRADPTSADTEKLKADGIIDASMDLTREARPVIELLARAPRCARVMFATPMGGIEKTAYFLNGDRLLADTSEDGLTLMYPVRDAEIRDFYENLFGTSTLCTASLDLEFSAGELEVFLGLCDVARRRVLEQLSGSPRQYRKVTLDVLHQMHEAPWSNGLVRMVGQSLPGALPPRDAMEKAVGDLCRKGVAESKEGDIRLKGAALLAAANLLLVESTLQLDRYALISGQPMGERTVILYGGLHDIWAIRPAERTTLLRTLSAKGLQSLIMQAMTEPLEAVSGV